MGVNNYFLLTQTISRLILGTGEVTSIIFIHSLLKLCVIKMTLDAYTCLRMFWIYKNHSSLINHHLRNVNRSRPPGFQQNNWPYLCLLGARCKTPSLQHGPWWPPRKQTKKKNQTKGNRKTSAPFWLWKPHVRDKCTSNHCTDFPTHQTDLSLKYLWWSTRVPLVGMSENTLLMTSWPLQTGKHPAQTAFS